MKAPSYEARDKYLDREYSTSFLAPTRILTEERSEIAVRTKADNHGFPVAETRYR